MATPIFCPGGLSDGAPKGQSNAQLIAEINQRQRLEAAERIRSQEMAVADEVARILTSTLHPDQVYDGFGNEVKKLVDYTRYGTGQGRRIPAAKLGQGLPIRSSVKENGITVAA